MRCLQKVGIVGVGGVGTFFGSRLAEVGHDVRFQLRKGRAVPESFQVESWQGNYSFKPSTQSEEKMDWVLVCLKSTAIDCLEELVTPMVGPSTRVQLLMNGLGAEEAAAQLFGPERIHGGLVYGGFTKTGDVVRHEGVPAEIRGGSFVDDPKELEAAVDLWQGANVTYTPQPCLLKAQWSKLAWNIPFNGLTVASGGVTVKDVWRNDNRHVAKDLMREVCRAANANLKDRGKPVAIDEDGLVDMLSSITDKMAAADYIPSTTLDFRNRRPMEIDAIFAEPLKRAKSLNVDTPRLELLTSLLQLINEKP